LRFKPTQKKSRAESKDFKLVRDAGFTSGEIKEIVARVALNISQLTLPQTPNLSMRSWHHERGYRVLEAHAQMLFGDWNRASNCRGCREVTFYSFWSARSWSWA
jgi:hypothetical protein